MEMLSLHFAPLLFIPGVALLIASTSNRLISVNNRIMYFKEHKEEHYERELRVYEDRVCLFRRSLIALYICIGFYSFATLLNCFFLKGTPLSITIVNTVMTLGACCLFYSILLMIKESWIALKLLKSSQKTN